MRLHEEYVRRCRLKIPIVNYDCKSFVFLYDKNILSGFPDWRMLHCVWCGCESHPGHFKITYIRPIYNGYSGECFESILPHSKQAVYWDQYVDFFIEFSMGLRGKFLASPVNDNLFVSWKILLYLCDSYLTRLASRDQLSLIGRSIDPGLSVAERQRAIEFAEWSLPEEIRMFWRQNILQYANIKSDWLVNLING